MPSSRISLTATAPRPSPSAISGASGPRTSPSPRVASAAGRMLARAIGGMGSAPRPSRGECPPWPGSRTAAATSSPASPGTRTTYHQAGSLQPRSSGITSQTRWIRSWIAVWKSTAANATGTPSSAASTSVRTYALASESRTWRTLLRRQDPDRGRKEPRRLASSRLPGGCYARGSVGTRGSAPSTPTERRRGIAVALVPRHRRRRAKAERDVVRPEEICRGRIGSAFSRDVPAVHELDERKRTCSGHDLHRSRDRGAADLEPRARVVQDERGARVALEVPQLPAT